MTGRILILMPQSPFDVASGAASSTRTIGQWLAGDGYEVVVLAPALCESPAGDTGEILAALGIRPFAQRLTDGVELWRFSHSHVNYRLIHAGSGRANKSDDPAFVRGEIPLQAEFLRILAEFRPNCVMAYGASTGDIIRRELVCAAGIPMVMVLHNLGYKDRRCFESAADVLVPTQFMARQYAPFVGRMPTVLPLPIDEQQILSKNHDPIMTTLINPAYEKGLLLYLRLADMLCQQRPDIPLLIVEARATAGDFIAAADHFGLSLRHRENLLFASATPKVADIYAMTRTLLVPSVIEEAAGRVAAEAMLNGIPALVSNRGGLPEICGNPQWVIPLPDSLTLESRELPSCEAAAPWVRMITQFADDDAAYQHASSQARRHARKYSSESAGQYRDYIAGIISKGVRRHWL